MDTRSSDHRVPAIAYTLMRAGELAAGLHASGFTLPAEDLLNPSNILLAQDGRTILAPLAPVERLKPSGNPPVPLAYEEVVEELGHFGTAIGKENWTFFAAGYYKESERRDRGSLAHTALQAATPSKS